MENLGNNFYIRDLPFIEENNNRLYLVHDNFPVYDENGKRIDYWARERGKDYWILPITECKHDIVRNAFKIFDIDSGNLDLQVILNDQKFNVFLDYPISFAFVKEMDIGIDKLRIPVRFGKNRRIFSKNILASMKSYKENIENIKRVKKRNTGIGSNRKYNDFVTKLTDAFPQKKYDSEEKMDDNIHFGQLKLLCSEIEFLTNSLSKNRLDCNSGEYMLVIYPGGGPGDHVPLLTQLFPQIRVLLVDPVFDKKHSVPIKIVPDDKISLRASLFTEEMQRSFDGTNYLLISDIRSCPNMSKYAKNTPEYEREFEKHVKFDMDLQRGWAERAGTSLLKFRLPYDSEKTEYLCGNIYFQAFAPAVSTETRLVYETNEKNKRKTARSCIYDNRKYDDQLFYFNTEYRNKNFYDKSPLFGKNYDILRMSTILSKYLKFRRIPDIEENIFNLFQLFETFFTRMSIIKVLLE